MNRPSDPILSELAHAAENIQLNIPFEEIDEHMLRICQGGTRLPKHVKKFPNTQLRAMAGLYVGGKYRTLAYCPTVETAARLADVLVVAFDEYRKHGIRTDPKSAAIELNFPLEHTLRDIAECESLQVWLNNLMAYLLHTGMLKERGFKSISRPGRPQAADTAAKLRERLESIEKRLEDAQQSLNTIIDRLNQQPVITITETPNNPQPYIIGWPPPVSPGDYPNPIVTCGSNIPK